MATTVTNPTYDQIVVNVPHLEVQKFLAIVKALGFSIEKKSELKRAIEDVEEGKVLKCSSLEDLISKVG